MKTISIVILLAAFVHSFAQNVIRGPYMQSPTHESIIIMWRTDVSTSTKVWYGTDSTNLNFTEEINNNVTNHTLKLIGLNAGSSYYYSVGDLNGQLTSPGVLHQFTTHPVPGTSVPTRIWAIGDFGRASAGQIAVKQSYENWTGDRGTDVWLWLGDNAYDDGSDAQYQQKLFDVNGFADIFGHVPFWPSPGNHDYNSVWEESTFLGIPYSNIALSDHEGPYYDLVEVPQFAEAGGYPSQLEVFYSFDYGDVHFLSLNSEVFDFAGTDDGINQMNAWITADLQQNTRKFTIAYFHQPPYSKGSHDSDDVYELVMKAMREKVIPVLESFDVDLVVCGHSHVFERSYLTKGHTGNSSTFNATHQMDASNGNFDQGTPYVKDGSNLTAEGTVYVVCGNSGSSESSPSLDHPAMVYTNGGSGEMGSFVIDIYKNKLDAKYLKMDGSIADEFTILKQDLEVLSMSNLEICLGDTVDINALFTGGSDSISFTWLPAIDTLSTASLSPTATTTYTLQVIDNLTGQIETTTFTVNVNQFTPSNISELVAGTLSVNICTSCSYQWYLNGNVISGANQSFYLPGISGDYSCLVTNAEGCETFASTYNYSSTATISLNSSDEVVIYPNPTTEEINLLVPSSLVGEKFEIVNMLGQVVKAGIIGEEANKISLLGLKSGNYILKIKNSAIIKNLNFQKI